MSTLTYHDFPSSLAVMRRLPTTSFALGDHHLEALRTNMGDKCFDRFLGALSRFFDPYNVFPARGEDAETATGASVLHRRYATRPAAVISWEFHFFMSICGNQGRIRYEDIDMSAWDDARIERAVVEWWRELAFEWALATGEAVCGSPCSDEIKADEELELDLQETSADVAFMEAQEYAFEHLDFDISPVLAAVRPTGRDGGSGPVTFYHGGMGRVFAINKPWAEWAEGRRAGTITGSYQRPTPPRDRRAAWEMDDPE